jgi:hypothetical protein
MRVSLGWPDLRGGVLGSNEQIFGADEQVPKGGCGRCPKNTLWTTEFPTRNAERKG